MIVSNERNDTLCNGANFMALMQTCLLCAADCWRENCRSVVAPNAPRVLGRMSWLLTRLVCLKYPHLYLIRILVSECDNFGEIVTSRVWRHRVTWRHCDVTNRRTVYTFL